MWRLFATGNNTPAQHGRDSRAVLFAGMCIFLPAQVAFFSNTG